MTTSIPGRDTRISNSTSTSVRGGLQGEVHADASGRASAQTPALHRSRLEIQLHHMACVGDGL